MSALETGLLAPEEDAKPWWRMCCNDKAEYMQERRFWGYVFLFLLVGAIIGCLVYSIYCTTTLRSDVDDLKKQLKAANEEIYSLQDQLQQFQETYDTYTSRQNGINGDIRALAQSNQARILQLYACTNCPFG